MLRVPAPPLSGVLDALSQISPKFDSSFTGAIRKQIDSGFTRANNEDINVIQLENVPNLLDHAGD